MSNSNTNLQTQSSNALHNAIMEAGSKDRPPMLAPGNYVQWKSRIKRYIDTKPNSELIHHCLQNPPYTYQWAEKTVPVAEGSSETTTERYMENYKNVSQDIRDQLNAEAEAVQIILTGIDNDIYSTVDACPNACEMWKAIERLKQGESINVQDLETNLYWEFGKFTSRDGESLESYYSRFYKMMNELVRNQCHVTNHQVNVQFLLQLQPEWQRFVTLVKQSQELKTVSYHKLYDILKQHQNEVNEIRAERLARTANPLALVAQQQPVYHHQNHPTQNTQYSSTRSQQSTRNRGKAIVTSSAPTYDPEPATVTEDEEMSKEKEIDKLMALISLSFKKIYKPTNNNLRTSSNTSRANQDNSPRINRGTGYDNQRAVNVAGARENVGTPVVQKSGIQCYNCKEYGHVSRECQKPKRVKDAAYHKEKMLLCKQEEAGVQLNAEQADWKDDTDDESERTGMEDQLYVHGTVMFKDLKMFQAELDKYNDVNYASKFAKPGSSRKIKERNPRLYDIGCYIDNLGYVSPNSDDDSTKQLIAVPISTREPKQNVNQSVATSSKKTVATDFTVKKSRNITRKLYEQVSKTCSWWYPKYTPPGYNWKPKSQKENVNPNISMPLGNAYITANILEHKTPRCSTVSNTPLSSNSFAARTVKFGNDQIAPILGYEDLVQGTITIKWVYYVEGLNHKLFSVGQFYDADLEVSFWKSTCYICDLKGNDLLTGSRGTDLYGENLDKMKEKGDAYIFVGYSTQSKAYRVFNKRTRMIVETIHVNFDELPQMASAHVSSDPDPQCSTTILKQDSLSPDPQRPENVPQVAETVTMSNELELLYSPMLSDILNGTSHVVSKSSAVHAADNPDKRQHHNTTHTSITTDVADPPPLNIHSTHQTPTQVPTVTAPENIIQAETNTENA
ncbi:retrovirus-related pol polyprotein from transposon TNT 1-94 [Tanacetum coccineum]